MNVESHRNYIAKHRADASRSARYAAHEETFVSISKEDGAGGNKQAIFKFPKQEKLVLDTFMDARNNSLLFGKCNFDKAGKCMMHDPEDGQPIPSGDGVISQVERFANQIVYSKLTVGLFDEMMRQMGEKAEKMEGNTYTFILTNRML